MNEYDARDRLSSERSTRPAPPADLLQDASLFLDFDGTLVEIADRPDGVVVSQELTVLLVRLRDAMDGRVAIISGRSLATLDALLPGLSMAMSGSHGLEVVTADGRIERPEAPEALDNVRTRFEEFAADRAGVIVEPKTLGVGLHYREAPEQAEAAEAVAVAAADAHGLPLQRGKMVFEVRAAGGHKGDAIAGLMRQAPFAGTRPIFLGDDVTDEDGFAAAHALGGHGVLVGFDRESGASYRLGSVIETLEWLEAACPAAR